jgi:hypothetical protein
MHTWLLRHRARLRLIYGLPAATKPAAEAPVDEHQAEQEPPQPRAEGKRSFQRLRRAKHRPAPGTLQRKRSYVLLAPMPRKSA